MNGEELVTVGVCMMLVASGICCLGLLGIHRVRRGLLGREALADDIWTCADQVVTRLEDLEHLVAVDSERRIAEIRTLLDQADDRITELRSPDGGPGQSPPPSSEPSPRHSEVLRLAGRGLDTGEIARRLEMHAGEVDLVLGLHRCAETETDAPPDD